VTGGGLPGNVPRIVPDGLAARLEPRRWALPSVMRLMGALGGIGEPELRATFNGGLGMVLAVPPGPAVEAALAAAAAQGMHGEVVGEVVPVGETGGRRYEEVG
jgi:phosphoribosylformylglycinamidine cyclo-ligase